MSSDEDDRYNRFHNDQERSRSRGPTRSRSRSRSSQRRSRSPRRSVSRRQFTPPRLQEPQTAQVNLEQLLNQQQEYIQDLITTHKEEVGELVSSKTQSFRSKGIEKQFNYNAKVSTRLSKIKRLLKKKKTSKALDAVRDLVSIVKEHSDDLLVADSSRHGWLTVHQLRGGGALSSDLLKKVEKIDSRLDKSKPRQNGQTDRPRKGQYFAGGMESQTVQTWRKKQGPEEALLAFSKTRRQGICTHCTQAGHFYRECPDFWKSVNESRKKTFTQDG